MLVLVVLAACRREGQYRGDCLDRADNDQDGLVDCDDPSCGRADRCRFDTFDTFDPFESGRDAGPVTISYNWDNDGLAVSVENLEGSGFDLGIAETASSDGWFGEDCFNGTGSFTFCHAFSGDFGRLAALGDGDVPGAPEDVVPGSTTLLNQDLAFEADGTDRLTYMVTVDSGECMVWGDSPDYYSTFACVVFE